MKSSTSSVFPKRVSRDPPVVSLVCGLQLEQPAQVRDGVVEAVVVVHDPQARQEHQEEGSGQRRVVVVVGDVYVLCFTKNIKQIQTILKVLKEMNVMNVIC